MASDAATTSTPADSTSPASTTSDATAVQYGPDSHDLMVDAARMSRMAYTASDTIAQWWQDKRDGRDVPDADTSDLFDRLAQAPVFLNDTQSDAQGYGLVYNTADGPVAVLAFRGTSSLADAVADSQVQLVPLKSASVQVPPRLLVHRGFLGEFLRLEKDCDAFLKSAGLPRVLCVGHSMGAAASAITATVYGLQKYEVAHISFGQPRPGSTAWAAVFDKVVQWSFNVKNGKDPVPSCIPPVVYTHVGVSVHVGQPDPFPDLCMIWDICDHDVANYLAHLKVNQTTPETPQAWIPYLYGFCINTPVRVWYGVKNFSFI